MSAGVGDSGRGSLPPSDIVHYDLGRAFQFDNGPGIS